MKTTPIKTVSKVPGARFLVLATMDADNNVLRKIARKNVKGYQ